MELVSIVVAVALLEYLTFGMLVGRARMKYDVQAPAVSGNETFERYYRVQQNTTEQLMIFLPAITIYGFYGNATYAAIAGLFFIVGRALYCRAYINDPASRGLGFMIGFVANAFLLLGGLFVTIRNIL
jgi:glutathione S-transferase